MKNEQLFPFERNRYYGGKMLTSADFTAEQLYMNNKRRFLNRALYGTGVICGLNVLELEDSSILVENGAALDGAGREIVVAESVVKKLQALKGYHSITGEKAFLCLRYKEEEVHPMFCAMAETKDKEYQCGRIEEGYELFLTEGEEEEISPERDGFFREGCILDNEDFKLVIKMPVFVSKRKEVKISLILYKKTEQERELSFEGKVFMPGFLNEKGSHELFLHMESRVLIQGEKQEEAFWMQVEPAGFGGTSVILKREEIKLCLDEEETELMNDVHFEVFLEDMSPEELSMREFGKLTWEKKQAGEKLGVRLAQLSLVRRDASCVIGEIREKGVKEYIVPPAQRRQQSLYLSYFREGYEKESYIQEEGQAQSFSREKAAQPENMAWGRVEIPLSEKKKKGDICYSQEIMHGLGKGNVYVDVGIEYLEDDPRINRSMRTTIYGNSDLFPQSDCMDFQTAVKVMNDKGSFQIGAKLVGEQKSIILQMSWAAIRFSTGKDSMESQEEERSIVPKVSTVRLKTKESYFFEVEFRHMEKQRLTYELTEDGSGEIGEDGVYIAPAKEGVYEICIYCTDMPQISTYVYAIVNR